MFCYQCQETFGNKGCNATAGACGKKAATSDLQDLLVYVLKGIKVCCFSRINRLTKLVRSTKKLG